MTSAAYFRAYRAAHGEHIRELERERRKRPDVRKARHAQETARRARIRSRLAAQTVPLEHPLLDWASTFVPAHRSPGTVWTFPLEALIADLRSEAILARLEGRDPAEAVRAYRARELAWLCATCGIVEDVVA